MKRILILSIFLCATAQVQAETKNHRPHVHGLATLVLAIESETTANIDLDVAGDSIFGFEHEAKTDADKKAFKDGMDKLKNQAANVIRFDTSLKCIVQVKNVGLEKAEVHEEKSSEHHGQHMDVNAAYTVTCQKPLSGSSVKVGLIGMFPKIKSASLQILTSTNQAQQKVKSENDSIALP